MYKDMTHSYTVKRTVVLKRIVVLTRSNESKISVCGGGDCLFGEFGWGEVVRGWPTWVP